ncbi:5'-adenylylsulfate reductase-like 4 [Oryza glaberrima]|uniref:Thioredoxin domain-containing protein n=2 Tax=Oryza TaxID=4527 RepID=A0A0D3H069_9ORYZ|nr:5'-adenylylsulfate reductase-like 4 [Oryza glaberrima]
MAAATASASASASAAAFLLLPLLAAAATAGHGVCPRQPAAAAVLPRQAPAASSSSSSSSCPAAGSPGHRAHHVGVVEGDDVVLQKAVTLVLQNREDFVAILFYASWCPFSKIFRTDFQKLSSFFPTIAHFSFEESRIKPRMLSRYGVRAFPTLFLVNSTMRVRYHGSRTMNSLAMFYKDVTGMNPVSLDAISLERMEEAVNIIENDKKTEQGDSLFMFARSPDRLLHQDTCLALASSFVLMRLLRFLLPKLNACVKQAWRMQFYELKRLFPSLS